MPLTASRSGSSAGQSGSQATFTLRQAVGAAAPTGLGDPAPSRSPPAALSALSASTPSVVLTRRP
eukprot:10709310-Alexandrium_andersonii.AAC.1